MGLKSVKKRALKRAFFPRALEIFGRAKTEALESGKIRFVLTAEDGRLYRLYGDGRKEFVKNLESAVVVKKRRIKLER